MPDTSKRVKRAPSYLIATLFVIFIFMDNKFTYTAHIEVRFAETDAMGVVHHATYPIWFEQARTEFFRTLGAPYAEMEKEGFESPVLEINVQYKHPCHYGEIVDVETSFERVDKLRCRFNYKVISNGTLCTIGYSIHVFTKNGMPTREKPACFKKVEEIIDASSGE